MGVAKRLFFTVSNHLFRLFFVLIQGGMQSGYSSLNRSKPVLIHVDASILFIAEHKFKIYPFQAGA